jgi:hypothetical protein
VLFGKGFTLSIDQHSPDLLRLHQKQSVECSAFITAYNPFDAELTFSQNAERQSILTAELRQRGLGFVPGVGQHPSNGWAGEPSFLVLGC